MVTSYLPRVLQDGRTVPTPEVHQLILKALQLKPGEKVLEVGTGSGTTARELAQSLCTCLCDGCCPSPIGAFASVHHCGNTTNCSRLEIHTIELKPIYGEVLNPDELDVYFHVGDGKLGIESESPFDAICVTCGSEVVSEAWRVQLKEGGRLIMPLGSPAAQRLVLFNKVNGVLKLDRVIAYVRFSMMREEPI